MNGLTKKTKTHKTKSTESDLCVAVSEMINSFEKTNVPTCLIGNLKELVLN